MKAALVSSEAGSYCGDLWNPASYLAAVRNRVLHLEAEGICDFAEVCANSYGAFPSIVRQFTMKTLDKNEIKAPGERLARVPNESPAQGEWYFSAETARYIHSILSSRPLLLGAPTIAELERNGLLIDSSRWLYERFQLDNVEVVNEPVETVRGPWRGFDSAVVDPPWYGAALQSWLCFASSLTRRGGVIVMPVLGSLTRPDATTDRRSLVVLAESIGKHTLLSDVVTYEIPHFEMRAMQVCDIHLHFPWRRADLLIVRNDQPCTTVNWRRTSRPGWRDYRAGEKVISLRRRPVLRRGEQTTAFGAVPRTIGWTLPSVSHRHPSLRFAGLWSSENRIAEVYDGRAVESMLDVLDKGIESSDASALKAALLESVE